MVGVCLTRLAARVPSRSPVEEVRQQRPYHLVRIVSRLVQGRLFQGAWPEQVEPSSWLGYDAGSHVPLLHLAYEGGDGVAGGA